MDPYRQEVINTGLSALEQQRQRALNVQGDQAIGAGAAFGSRHAIREGVTNAESARAAAEFTAQQNSAAYHQAVSAIQNDQQRAASVGLANQQANIATNQLQQGAEQFNAKLGADTNQQRLAAAGLLGDLTQLRTNLNSQEIGLLDQTATQGREYQQQLYDAQFANAQNLYNAPMEAQNARIAALDAVPYNQQTVTRSSGGNNRLAGAASGAAMGAAVGGPWGAVIGGVGGAILSDPDTKENIRTEAIDPITGIPVKSYEYKDDPETAPRRFGLMADDVEEHIPQAVFRVGSGKKSVRGILTDELPPHLRPLADQPRTKKKGR
jgi:hypothetical protein